ncbi:MAG TPA: efflux RND transporter periplasmic adaptor subunit [Candidatus Methylomirabilis sp.]|nr:efflux RND transporter periplasmic adaptor subunit [Candidatus Methylomirabilis sp.]
MNRKHLLISIAIAASVIVGAALVWHTHPPQPPAAAAAAKAERRVLYWTDPMVPGFRSDKPGKSPFMDMELVPVYAGEAAEAVVTVHPEIANSLGVRTYQITRTESARRLTVQGYLFRDGGQLYALVDVLDRDATTVRPGLAATVRVADLPGREWEAAVERVESDIDIGGRALKARVRINSPEAALKPNMFAEVAIRIPVAGARLVIPREALIRTGTRATVILALGAGRFQPVEVLPGQESGEWIEIQKGLKRGDMVVVSGQFLIDSEANVHASFERMEAPATDSRAVPGERKP